MKHLTLPLSSADIKSLKCGEVVALSGVAYTARDAAHKLLCDAIKNDEALPIDLKDACIFYAGPAPTPNGQVIGSCGPTTSSRMDDYTPLLLKHGLKVMIGKGKRSDTVNQSIKQYSAIYLAAIGGAGALMQSRIKSCTAVAYPHLGCEAIYKIQFDKAELVVATDCLGKTLLK